MADFTLNTIRFRRSFTAGYRPANLAEGEMLIQYADQKFILGGLNGATRVEVPFAGGSGGGSGPANTDALPEGASNLYFTPARARSTISVTGSLAYDAATGVISYSAPALATVATSGAYADLTGKPALATVATSGAYADLTGKPVLATVAVSGSASDLGAGTLPAARLPALTGDVTSTAGSAATTLAASGVTAGSYTLASITVDGKGRVTAASSGTAPPLNNFSATRAPTVTDDASAGYSAGSRWMNATTGDMYTCRNATTGAARWVKVDVADHPGYVVGRYYLPFGHGNPAIVGANAANTIYLAYGVVKQRVTISQLGARVTTVSAGGNFQLAIYQHNPATAGPGALVASTPSGSTATAAQVNIALASNLTLEPGAYWFACNQDNATAVFMALGLSSPAHASINGDASAAIPAGTSNASQVTGYSTASTFGTWPADLSAASLTNAAIGRNPMVQFLVATLAA